MKRFLAVLTMVLMVLACGFSQELEGTVIDSFVVNGIKNVSSIEINDILYPYRNTPFSYEAYDEMETALYAVAGVDYFSADADFNDQGGLVITFEFLELPKISSITYEGNEKVKSRDINEALATLKVGDFIDVSKKAVLEDAKNEVRSVYSQKGFSSIPLELTVIENEEDSTVELHFTVQEGVQTRVVSFSFAGNDNIPSSILRKQMTSKTKRLFTFGYLDMEKLKADCEAISLYYQTEGYIDIIVAEPVITPLETTDENYQDVDVLIQIYEGEKWYYGGLEVSGNTIFSDEEINSVKTLNVGDVLNLERVQVEYTTIADLYYNDGYISNGMNIYEERDDTNMTIKYYMQISEGPQATVEEILIKGLTKTKEYVMRRELEIKPGDVFSKAKLVTSAQNLYNTGLLSDLNYNLLYGQKENDVILEFDLEEGSQMDIQFGATFGGNLTGFPVSGFLQWDDRNFGGRGQQLSVGMTLSPDTQSLTMSFGDNWFKDYRWANSVSFSFSHSIYDNELQLGTGATKRYNGRNEYPEKENETWPLGFVNALDWYTSGNEFPAAKDLMTYRLLTFSLGYNTGYTFIYDFGRLSFSGGVSVSLNKALYDHDLYDPYEDLIYKYGKKWQFSNKLNLAAQWDGRDYVTNTTKGYVLSTGVTYAGGLFGGLSNYIKLTESAAGYLKLFSVTVDEQKKNIMLCASTSASFMFPQFYLNTEDEERPGLHFHDPKLGATKYEMLYIDGMTIARGFPAITDQAFLWDNMLEISYPLVDNVIQAEAFVSATGITKTLDDIRGGINWYYSAGAGIRLKISGFPLGLYLVKNATYINDQFSLKSGAMFHNSSRPNSGMSLVLAISTSLI